MKKALIMGSLVSRFLFLISFLTFSLVTYAIVSDRFTGSACMQFNVGVHQVGKSGGSCCPTIVTIFTKPDFDITHAETPAIVNPANSMLAHGGGIARAISDAAGSQLRAWSEAQRIMVDGKRLGIGKAVLSPSFDLKKRGIEHIVHTVGPDCRVKKERDCAGSLLYDAWYNALMVADSAGITSITFPSISTGIFTCPKEVAAQSAARALEDFFMRHPQSSIKEVSVGLWADVWHAYADNFAKMWPTISNS